MLRVGQVWNSMVFILPVWYTEKVDVQGFATVYKNCHSWNNV